MRLFIGGTNGLVLYEDGEISELATELVLCAVKPSTGRLICGTDEGRILAWEGNGGARTVAKDLGEEISSLNLGSTGVIYCGTLPASFWFSKDSGEVWNELGALGQADGSERWTAPWGTPHTSALATHPKNAKTVYAGIEVGGIYRSRDGGKKWFNLGIPSPDMHAIQVSPAKHDRVYVTTGDGAYCSDDEGFNWRRMGVSNRRQYTMGVAAHPAEADRVIISAASGPPPAWSRGGASCDVYLSTDGGRRFRTVAKDLKGGVQRGALVINPKVPSEVVFGTSKGEVFYSNDGGESFDRVATKQGDVKTIVFA